MIVCWELLGYQSEEPPDRGYLLRVTDNRGLQGVGEAHAIEGFGSGPEALDAFLQDKRALVTLITGLASRAPGELFEPGEAVPREALFAVETALHDLWGRQRGVSVAQLLGAQGATFVMNSILVGDEEQARELAAAGHRQFKLKAHGNAREWRELLDVLLEATGGEAQVRIDANGSWDRKLALAQTAALPDGNVVFIEQPFPQGDLASCRWFREQTGLAVALDEGAHDVAEIARIAREQAADAVVIKPMFRGLCGALALARAAAREGLGICFTHSMDGTVGRLAALQLAAAAGDANTPNGLFMPGLPWLASEPRLDGDRLPVPASPGLGIEGLADDRMKLLAREFALGSAPDVLAEFARRDPQRLAIRESDGSGLSAQALDEACERVCRAMWARGVRCGSVVGLAGPPTFEWLAALTACWRLGAVAAPLNHRSPPAEQDAAAQTLGCDLTWHPGEGAAHGELPVLEAKPREGEWPLLRVCTSGTTDEPRCVELTAAQMLCGAAASALRLGHRDDDCWLVCLPVNHVGALAAIFRCLNNGITLELHREFDVATVSERLDSGDISLVSLVPAMLDSLLQFRDEQAFAASVRAILLGGAACSEGLLARCRKASVPVALTWGMSEAGSQLATRVPGDLSDLACGLPPLPFVDVEVARDGRLVVHAPMVGGSLTTSDLGTITPKGRVSVLGRADAVIVRGGENIQPEQVEGVLLGCPGVEAAVVIGEDDARLGQVPVAYVQCPALDEAALRAWCRERLDGFKVPVRFVRIATMPRTDAGKIDRRALPAAG